MSKTKKDAAYNVNRRYDERFEDHNARHSEDYRRHKNEKKVRNALRSNNIDELMSLENY